MSTITGYHAHVYYDAATTREQARQLCEAAGKRFPLTVGRMHDNPVGPHPRGSCQLAFAADHLAEVLALARSQPRRPHRFRPRQHR